MTFVKTAASELQKTAYEGGVVRACIGRGDVVGDLTVKPRRNYLHDENRRAEGGEERRVKEEK